MLRFSRTTTGTVLFALDTALILLVWPLVLWLSRPDALSLFMLPTDSRGVAYPAFDLLLLFAMGLYRRDAILESARSLTRVPLVVGMGAALAILVSLIQQMLLPWAVMPGGRDQAMLFGLAVVTFTFCAFTARAVIDVLVRRHVLRRRLLIVGAGQRLGSAADAGPGRQQSARRRHTGA
jgi:FlaA1/EpsC-like NDP-sugar epimerase